MVTTVTKGFIAAMLFVVDLASLIQDTGQQIDFEALADSDYDDGNGRIHVPAGAILGRLPNRKMVPVAAAVADTGDAEAILLTDAFSDSRTDSLTGYGVTYGGVFYENLLPDADTGTGEVDGAIKTELGARFVWKRHYDSRGA